MYLYMQRNNLLAFAKSFQQLKLSQVVLYIHGVSNFFCMYCLVQSTEVLIADLYPTCSDPFETEPGLPSYIIRLQLKDGVAR